MKAYELIEKPGTWNKGAYRITSLTGEVESRCASGALRDAYLEDQAVFEELYNLVCNKISEEELAYCKGITLCNWNDAPERTQEEVVALLKEVELEYAKKKEQQ